MRVTVRSDWADLRGAYLFGADLHGVRLHGVDASGADFRCADLSGGVLTGSNFSGAHFWGADLSGVDLSGSTLQGGDFSCTDMRGIVLTGTDLSGADLSGADLSGAVLPSGVPVVEHLDDRILEAVTTYGILDEGVFYDADGLRQSLAGWAVTLAGEAGERLEDLYGTAAASTLIYWASTGSCPNLYCGSSERALEALRQRVAPRRPRETSTASSPS